jgi:hypothetical protein
MVTQNMGKLPGRIRGPGRASQRKRTAMHAKKQDHSPKAFDEASPPPIHRSITLRIVAEPESAPSAASSWIPPLCTFLALSASRHACSRHRLVAAADYGKGDVVMAVVLGAAAMVAESEGVALAGVRAEWCRWRGRC